MRPLPSEELTFQTDSLCPKGQLEAKRMPGSLAQAYMVAPNETTRCLVGGRKKGARECWLQEVTQPGLGRVEPRCPHFGLCGGCALQHLSQSTQLALKTQTIVNKLRQAAGDFRLLAPVAAANQWYYRSKIELSFIKDDLGFNKRGYFDHAINVQECFIGPCGNREILQTVRRWAREHRYSGWSPRENSGYLRYLVIRRSSYSGQFLVAIVTTTPPDEQPLHELAQELAALGATGVIHAVHNSPSAAINVESSSLLYGQSTITEKLGPLSFDLHWRSFFQSNPPAFYTMLQEVKSWIEPGQRLLDLYCGVGTIGLSLGGQLTGVEFIPEAIENAKANAAKAGIDNAQFFCGCSEDWPSLDCDVLILDPPRSGIHPKLVKRLPSEGPERILYISCNPARFIDEYEVLKTRYKIDRVRMFDFFPHTPHVEMAVLLTNKASLQA